MNRNQILLTFLLIISMSIISSIFTTLVGENKIIDFNIWGKRIDLKARTIVYDPHDLDVFFREGSWILSGEQPYKEVFSEYPQIATYVFAIPHIITNWLEFFFGSQNINRKRAYDYIFSLMMALCSAVLIILIYNLRPQHKFLAFLLLLPASFYFIQNRFDVLPSMLTIASLYLLQKHRFKLSFILLAVSVMTKWYAIILFPIFMTYYYSLYKRINWKAAASFFLTILVIILPTILLSGWKNFLSPYTYHLQRVGNSESLFFLLTLILKPIDMSNTLSIPFLLLQFGIAALSVFALIDNKEKILVWSALAIFGFILFAKFYSPQWWLWISPFLILLARTKKDVILIIAFDLLTYAYFPFIYGLKFTFPFLLISVVIFKTIFILYLMSPLLPISFKSLRLKHSTWNETE